MVENTSGDAVAPAKNGLGLLGGLLLGGIAAATSFATAFLVPSTGPSSAAAPSQEAPVQQAPDKDVEYVELPDLLVTIGGDPADRYIKMQITVVAQKSSTKKIEAAQPLLLDAFTTYLRSVDPRDFEDPSFYGHMRAQLGARAQLVVGASTAEGVLITEFLLR